MPHSSSSNSDILLVGSALARECEKSLSNQGYGCKVASDREGVKKWLESQVFTAMIGNLHPDAGGFEIFELAKEYQSSCSGIAIAPAAWEFYISEISRADFPHHFISALPTLNLRELTVTLEKIRTGDIFGIERYDIPVHESIRVGEGEGRYPHISKVKDFFLQQGIPARLAERAEVVIHELVTNARKTKKDHSSDEGEVRLDYGVGLRSFGASVSDPWGELESRRLFAAINRAIQDRTVLDHPGRGAGIGLLMSFKATNALVFNVSPGRSTEAIAIFHRQESSGKSLKMGHSLNYFRGRDYESKTNRRKER